MNPAFLRQALVGVDGHFSLPAEGGMSALLVRVATSCIAILTSALLASRSTTSLASSFTIVPLNCWPSVPKAFPCEGSAGRKSWRTW